MTRQEILARARAASSDDEVQVVGYSEAEVARSEAVLASISKLRELRALWKKEDNNEST